MKNLKKYISALLALSVLAPVSLPAQSDPSAPVEKAVNGFHMKVSPGYDPNTQTGRFVIETFVEGNVTVTTQVPPLDILFAFDDHGSMSSNVSITNVPPGVTTSDNFQDIVNLLIQYGFIAQLNSIPDIDARLGLFTFPQNSHQTSGFVSQTAFLNALPPGHQSTGGGFDSTIGMDTAATFMNTHTGTGRTGIAIFITNGEGSIDASIVTKAYALKQAGYKVATVLLNCSKTNANDRSRMEAASSNYPNATSTSNLGTRESDAYYCNTNDYSALNSFFESLATEVATGGSSVELGVQSYIKDVFPRPFVLPEGEASITVYEDALVSVSGSGDSKVYTFRNDPVDITEAVDVRVITSGDSKEVSIGNWSYSLHWCGWDGRNNRYNGSKLITVIEYKLSTPEYPKLLLTGEGSGFYDDQGNLVMGFPEVFIRLAAIRVTKAGLKKDETAVFKLFDENSVEIAIFVLKGVDDSGTTVKQDVVMPTLYPGKDYTVQEVTAWRWSYDSSSIGTNPLTKSVPNPETNDDFTVFPFGAASARDKMPKNAENDKLNVLIPIARISVDPDVDPYKGGGNFRMEF